MPPKPSWHAHLKENRCVLGGITMHPEGENLERSSLLGVFGMCCRIMDRSCKYVVTLMSRAHKSRAHLLAP